MNKTENKQKWHSIGRIGFIGSLSDNVEKNLSELYGNSWRKSYIFDGKSISRKEALSHYEESYFKYMKEHPRVLKWLTEGASDVYDNSKTNVLSGTDYFKQETKAVHLQDIAIRRVVKRLGHKFKGKPLLQIRGKKSRGYCLNPGVLPFYSPENILSPSRKGWWKPKSVEDFWQSKIVQLKTDYLKTKLLDDSIFPPGKSYNVKPGELDELSLQWCSFQTDNQMILGIGKKEGSRASEYYIRMDPPYDSAEYISSHQYYSTLLGNPKELDFIIRTGSQLPRNTIKRLRRLTKELKFIS
ncbi:hypothetical protein ACFLZZ_02500 [Nanoarchaeota archaeon]